MNYKYHIINGDRRFKKRNLGNTNDIGEARQILAMANDQGFKRAFIKYTRRAINC